MIQTNLFFVLQEEIALLTVKISAEREALEIEEDRERAELLRVRIRFVEQLLTAVEDARATIISASAQIGQMEQRFLQWRGICNELEPAKAEADALATKMQEAQHAVAIAQGEFDRAEQSLETFRNRRAPLPDLASEPEKRKYLQAEQKFHAKILAARENVRACADAGGQLQSQWLEATKKLNTLLFQERHARLPEEKPKPKIRVAS